MSNIISEMRQSVRKDGVALVDAKTYDKLQEEWIRRTLGDEVLAQIKQDLDEADLRAGKAERMLANERESAQARASWLIQAKADAGYNPNVSFDEVWTEALAALKEKQQKEEG